MRDIVTVRVEPGVKDKLEKLARATARTKSYLIADAIQEYLNLQEWQIEAIQEGMRQADEGKMKPHRQIKKKWERKVANLLDSGRRK